MRSYLLAASLLSSSFSPIMTASLHPAPDTLPRPPRLQPSPSLPNLRARNVSSDAHLTRPQPTVHKSSSQMSSLTSAKLSSALAAKDGDLHPSKPYRQQPKNQHYLTPPLTPASSLRSDSTDPDSAGLSPPSNDHPSSPSQKSFSGDSVESRFLIIGNVPSDISEDVIGPHFHSLAAHPDASPVARTNSEPGNIIQTIYYRFQEKRAIILAFYDIRDAERVKRLVETNGSRHESKTDGERGVVGSPWVKELTCLFVAPDHILELLGASASVMHTEGTFCVSVSRIVAERDQNYSAWSRVRSLVPGKIKAVLEKYGELRSFRLLKEDEEKCNQLFIVEYYDSRAGKLAWGSLNGHVIDNMKLRLIRRNVFGSECNVRDLEKEDLVGLEGHLGGGHAAEPKTPTASTYLSQSQTTTISSGVPFPLLNDAGACDYSRPYEHEGTNALGPDAGSVVNSHKLSFPWSSKILLSLSRGHRRAHGGRRVLH
ncbi:hypothetical protein JVU11DRAFT_2776 [Chiua virens]|nr:hypothetical protein JVU11DRAFT_2776 [Chiua virens]